MTKPKAPAIPAPRTETVRQAIMTLLREGWMTARELSAAVGISEKQVAAHLEHVRKSAGHEKLQLAVEPAECLDCGFVFKKRDRLQTPGKCPACRSEAISEPRYSLVPRD
jgi:predicted Zn-ribbon and HTH transcriptional regulator